MLIVLALLAIHFLADFVLQSDWIAQNKSKDWGVLSLHAALYASTFGLVLVVFGILALPYSWYLPFMAFTGITFVAHFLTDAVTSRLNSRLFRQSLAKLPAKFWVKDDPMPGVSREVDCFYWNSTPHNFFVGIGFDQLLHQAQLVLTAYWLGWLA